MMKETLTSLRGRARPAALFVLAALLLLVAVAANGRWSEQRTQRAARTAVSAQLKTLQADLLQAFDSTNQQIAMASHLLGWMEKTEDASSAELIAALSQLRQPHSVSNS